MAVTIVKPGRIPQVQCGRCDSILQYTPEDVSTEYTGNSYQPTIKRVQCPNKWCNHSTRIT